MIYRWSVDLNWPFSGDAIQKVYQIVIEDEDYAIIAQSQDENRYVFLIDSAVGNTDFLSHHLYTGISVIHTKFGLCEETARLSQLIELNSEVTIPILDDEEFDAYLGDLEESSSNNGGIWKIDDVKKKEFEDFLKNGEYPDPLKAYDLFCGIFVDKSHFILQLRETGDQPFEKNQKHFAIDYASDIKYSSPKLTPYIIVTAVNLEDPTQSYLAQLEVDPATGWLSALSPEN